MNENFIANELAEIARELMAMEFPTKDAMEKYLKEHPEANKSKHRVVETKKEAPAKKEEAPAKKVEDKAPEKKEPTGEEGVEHSYASFNHFELGMTREEAESCSHSGDCMADVVELMKKPHIKKQLDELDPDKLRKELKEYGAWDNEELKDNEANKKRILWLAAGNITEEDDESEDDESEGEETKSPLKKEDKIPAKKEEKEEPVKKDEEEKEKKPKIHPKHMKMNKSEHTHDFGKVHKDDEDDTKIRVYDNGGHTADRYSVVVDGKDWESSVNTGYVPMLTLSEGGKDVSQWGEGKEGSHLGRPVAWDTLSEDTKKHIEDRIKSSGN